MQIRAHLADGFITTLRLTPGLSPAAGLTFVRERALPGGSVEIVYAVDGRS